MNIESSILYGLSKLQYEGIKPDQKTIVENYLKGKDAFFCSPTGSGKSLKFEIAPFAFEYLCKSNEMTFKPLVIVVSPLSSLMRSQVNNLQKRSVNAIHLKDLTAGSSNGEFEPTTKNILDAHVDIIFGSPETLLGKNRLLLKELAIKGAVKAFFVDEAHCIRKL